MPSSGVLSGSLNQLRLQRGTVRIPIVSSAFLTNITIVGDTFQIATLDEFILDTVLKPSAASTDINYTVELFNETTGMVLQSFDCKVSPVSAPNDQSWLFTINVVDVTHFYSLRITTTTGNPDFAMSLSGPTFTMVISSLTATGGGAPISATPPIFVVANNITLGAAGSNATSPTTPDAASSVTWSPFDAAHKALVLQGKAAQAANIFEIQTSAGTVVGSIDAIGNMSIAGKLTVGGAIDPTSLSLTGANNSIFVDWADGQLVPVGAANHGRIIYNAATQTFQASQNGGAFTPLQIGTPTLAQVLVAGNTTGANNILVTVGQQIDTAAAGVLNLGNTNATALGIGNPSGGLSTFSLFINQGGASFSSNAGIQFSSTVANRAALRMNQFGNNAGIPGVVGFKSRGTNVFDMVSVADGDVLWRATAIGVTGNNINVPLAGFLSLQVPTGGTNPTWVATDFSISLVPLAGPINSNREVAKFTSEAALQFINGTTAPVSAAAHGAIRYNNATPAFEVSLNGGAWTALATATSDSLQAAYNAGQTINEAAVAGTITQTPITITNTIGTATDVLQLTKNPGAPFAGNGLTVSMGANATGTGVSVSMNAASTGIPFEVDPATGGFIRMGTPDSFGRDQIWHTGLNSILRLGADVSDGDPMSIDSQGMVIYEPSLTFANRIKSNRFGLTRSADTSLYYFRVDDTRAFYTSDPTAGPVYGANTVHWYVNRTSGLVGINNATAGFPVQVGTELLRVQGGTLMDFTSTTALQVAQAGGGAPALVVDTTNTRVGVGTAPGAFTLDVNGDTRISGKLTVTGAIDPTSLSLTGANNAIFVDWEDGQNVAVSAANHGRIRYNAATQLFEASQNGAAYVTMIGGGGSFPVLSSAAGTPVILTSASATVTGAGNTIAGGGGVLAATLVGGTNNVLIGSSVDVASAANVDSVAIGNTAVTPTQGVVIGGLAGNAGAIGSNFISIGYQSGRSISTGNFNTFVGAFSGFHVANGAKNTFLGSNSGQTGAANNFCTLIGYESGFSVTGDNNTFLGSNTGLTSATGTGNSLFGSAVDVNAAATSNAIVIGTGAGAVKGSSSSIVISAAAINSATVNDLYIASGDTGIGRAAAGILTINTGNGGTGSGALQINGVATGTFAVSPANTGRIIYDLTLQHFYISENGGAYAQISTGGGATAFSAITTGVNTTATMTVGAGASMLVAPGGVFGISNVVATDVVVGDATTGAAITTAAQCVFIGAGAGSANTASTDAILIGFNAASTFPGTSASSVIVMGSASFAASSSMTIGHGSGVATSTGARTYIFGASSGTSLTNAADNIFIGFSTGVNTTTGGHNVFIGTQAGQANTTAIGGTFVGYRAGQANTVGVNTFIGNNAGLANTTGDQNVFVGDQAGQANVAGTRNVFIGYQAGFSASTAGDTDSVCVGWKAGNNMNGTGFGQNTFVGTFAGEATTAGAANTFIGYGAAALVAGTSSSVAVGDNCNILNAANNCVVIGKGSTVGDSQISIGYQVSFLDPSNTGTGNILIGTGIAFGTQTSASNNTLVGNNAAVGLTTGSDNTILGFNTGTLLVGGATNTLIGSQVATAALVNNADNTIVGAGSGVNVVSDENSVFGAAAGLTVQTGGGNTLVGTSANVSNNTDANAIAIGISATASNNNITIGQNTGTLGMTGAGVILIGGAMGTGITTAANVVFIGDGTATALTTGTQSIFIGTGGTGSAVDTSSNNIGIGYHSLTVLNGASSNNVGVGNFTLTSVTAGVTRNTAFGDSAGASVVTGGDNVFVGSDCDAVSGTVTQSVAVGSQSWAIDNCVSVGFSAGSDLATGVNLTLIGNSAGVSLTSANDVTLLGYNAGLNLTSGDSSVFIGSQAGLAAITGTDNILIGRASNVVDAATIQSVVMGSSSVGVDQSVVIGYNSGINQTNAASGNVLIGRQVGNSLTSGQSNVFVGFDTGGTFDTGSHNVVIGDQITGGAGFAFCTLVGGGLTAAATNDLQVVSGDCGLQRADPAVIAFTGGGQIGVTPGGAMQLTGIPTVSAPPVAPANSGRIYYDSTLQQFMFSKNGGAYVALTIP
jgi:hypothetical protein